MAYVILGLGNPGPEYARTRHNAGRMAAELFAECEGLAAFKLKKAAVALVADGTVAGAKVQVALPEVAMNLSGKSALGLVKSKAAAKKLLVIRDDLDLPLGTLKMTGYGRGAGGHRGVESVARALKTKDFAQIKIGIAPATPKGRVKKVEAGEPVVEHVLGAFSPKQREVLDAALERAASAARVFVEGGIEKAMLFANTKP